MCFGDTALVDDVPAIADFIPAAERPVGATATPRELGARLSEDGEVLNWSDDYRIADAPFPVLALSMGPFAPALASSGRGEQVVAFVAKTAETQTGDYTEVWAAFDETGDGIVIDEDAILTRII